MNVTIVGGGNVGTQFAVHCAQKQHKVIIYTSKAQQFDSHLVIVDKEGNVIHEGNIEKATSDAEIAFCEADVIFITVPAHCIKRVADEICEYCKDKVKVGLIPGSGGGEWAFKRCIDKGITLFGLQRVPSVARLIETGKVVRAVGYRDKLHVSALPCYMTEEIRQDISDIFDMECDALPNYLNMTLTPSNPILHTTRLSIIFKDYREGKTYDSLPLFYEDWDDESSRLLYRCDDELQSICKSMTDVDLSAVKSLREHYNSDTPEALTEKIRSIEGFKGLRTPATQINGKYIPNLQSRYFMADFSYGLDILIQIAKLLNVNVPNMVEVSQWYNKIAVDNDKFLFSAYGVDSKRRLLEFYML